MQLSGIFQGLGEDTFTQLLRTISIGKLKTFQLYERMKVRLHLAKLNSETLRKAAPRLWIRVNESDEDFVSELSQAILISHMGSSLSTDNPTPCLEFPLSGLDRQQSSWSRRASLGTPPQFRLRACKSVSITSAMMFI